MIEDGDSISSSAPLSPPQNNKRIDNYFTPRDPRNAVSHSLFESKPLSSPSDNRSNPEMLSTPTHSRDVLHSPQKPSAPPSDSVIESTTSSDSRAVLSDVRSNDIHMLLMSKDTRIKELEHVEIVICYSGVGAAGYAHRIAILPIEGAISEIGRAHV